MRISKKQLFSKISKITYEDNTYYYGQETNSERKGYGKYCNEDTTIIKAGYWQNDECIEDMSENVIEEILKDLY